MAEYSKLRSGVVTSTGGATTVILPFVPSFIEITNTTRATGTNDGVTKAWWQIEMPQGSAMLTTTTHSAQDLTTYTTSGGFTTIQAGLSLQYGPVYNHAVGDFQISKANPAEITTTVAHGLVSGNVVIFQNLYQTSSTGMPQIAGIPFTVTVIDSTHFTINWNTNQSNYTAFNSATSTNNVGSWKQVLYPSLYAPGTSFITAITTGTTTTIDTTSPHNMFVGQEVAFRIPSSWGTTQLNSLPDLIIPGSPIYGYVTAVNSSTEVVVSLNSTGYTAFNSNQTVAAVKGQNFPQMVAVGDVNSGGFPYAGAALYPSPTVYNGTSTSAVSTINGPAIQGAYFNATYQGFIIGASVAGTASDTIYWRAYRND